MQLQLFEETKDQRVERQLLALQNQMDSVRKGLFARHTELSRLYLECKQELEQLKQRLTLP